MFVSLLSLSSFCGFELFTLIPRLDLGVVIVVACVYFDICYHFPLLHTSLFHWCEFGILTDFTTSFVVVFMVFFYKDFVHAICYFQIVLCLYFALKKVKTCFFLFFVKQGAYDGYQQIQHPLSLTNDMVGLVISEIVFTLTDICITIVLESNLFKLIFLFLGFNFFLNSFFFLSKIKAFFFSFLF